MTATQPMPPRLSALVVARNEAAQLADCLATLGFADEILVVLDRSTDASAAIARAHGARVLEGAWEIEGERRNAGLDACTGDWILEVDADERIPPALAEEVRRVIAASPHAWHRVPVDNYIGTRLVRHGWGGSFGTTLVPRLSRRGAKRWKPQRVHPGLEWRGAEGPRLTQPLIHHVDRDIADTLRRLDRYTDARAADLIARGEVGSTANNLRRFVSRFFKCFVARGGWREGGWGVLIALCAGLYPLLAHLKAKLEPERYGGGGGGGDAARAGPDEAGRAHPAAPQARAAEPPVRGDAAAMHRPTAEPARGAVPASSQATVARPACAGGLQGMTPVPARAGAMRGGRAAEVAPAGAAATAMPGEATTASGVPR